LTTVFGNSAVTTVSAADTSAARKKQGWLPLLILLFLISYGLMTMLIVEQGQTIESQRTLIRDLFRDSTELSSIKGMIRQEGAQSPSAKPQTPAIGIPSTQIPLTQAPSTHVPSTHVPSTQAPNIQIPSSQAGRHHRAQNQTAKQKPPFRMPSKPASDLVDDVRTLITI
jgi:hypothetical protein